MIEDAFKLHKDLKDKINSLKNYDYVQYCGGEDWKCHRDFSGFKLTAKDLRITEEHFETLKDILESHVWPFCDTVLSENAEDDEFVLDWCIHGERMGWKAGDEYWLVLNLAFTSLEIRKADPEKWTPLAKYVVNDDLELRFKLGYLSNNGEIKYLQELLVNSFPDRIELRLYRMEKDANLFKVLLNVMSQNYTEEVRRLIDYLFSDEKTKIDDDIAKLSQFDGQRIYNLDPEKDEDMQKVYDNVVRYSHQLKFYQKEDAQLKLSII